MTEDPEQELAQTAVPVATVAIVTRGRPEAVARNLGSAFVHLLSSGAEVLVVDQSEDDATRTVVQRMSGVRYERSAAGLSRGRNVAITVSAGSIVAFTDDDVVLPTGWLDGILHVFAVSEEAGAVCGRAVDDRGRLLAGARRGTYRRPQSPFGLGSGFNLALRREALDDAGSFDELLGAGARFRSAEDTDMLYRVMRSGWAVVCSDEITVVHDERRSLQEQLSVHTGYGLGAGAQTIKHVLTGDRLAARVGVVELGSHVYWFFRSIISLKPRIGVFQVCFMLGFARGVVGGWRVFRRVPGGSSSDTSR